MRNLKKLLAVIVTLAMIASFTIPAFAASYTYSDQATKLNDLGLYKGISTKSFDPDLGSFLTRETGIVMLLRIFGLEAKALALTDTDVNAAFSLYSDAKDVSPWAKKQMAYAIINGITLGTSATTLSPKTFLTGDMYAAFMYRQLGYTESTYKKAVAEFGANGILTAAEITKFTGKALTKDDLVGLSYAALKATQKADGKTLAQALVAAGIITEAKALAAGVYTAPAVALDFSVSATNYKEVVVTFNQAVDATKAADVANYTVANNTVVLATVAADNKSATLTLGTAIVPGGSVDVTVGTGLGMAVATKKTISNVIDSTLPTITSVVAKGNKKITVTFSEPVQNAVYLSNFRIDGNLFGTSANIAYVDATKRQVNIPLATVLAAGTHKLTVSGISDYATYVVSAAATEFAVATDTEAATVSLVSASQTTLKVKFSKMINAPSLAAGNIVVGSGTPDTATLDTDDMTLTVTFPNNTPLPATGSTTVTFKNITTLFGIKAADLVLTVSATPDLTRPEITSVAAQTDGQGYILVTFNKNISSASATTVTNYVLKDSNSAVVGVIAAYNTDTSGPIKTQVKLTPAAGGSFTSGTYTLLVQNVVDDNPLYNKILSVINTVVIADKIAPTYTVTKDVANNKLFVNFSEAVDATTAQTKANYAYTVAPAIYGLNADTTVTLLSDGKTVAIAFPAAAGSTQVLVSTISTIQVSGVKDLAGNVMTTAAAAAPFTGITLASAISSVQVTGANTIVINLTQPILDATKTISDFVIANTYTPATPIYAINIAYNNDTKQITLTTNETLTADGKYGGYSILLKTIAAPNATDVYGQHLVANETGVPAADKFAPTATVASAVYTVASGATKVTVNFSEALTANVVNDSFYVYANGTAVPVTATMAADKKSVELAFTSATDLTGLNVRVVYLVPATVVLKDATNNALAAFDQTVAATNP